MKQAYLIILFILCTIHSFAQINISTEWTNLLTQWSEQHQTYNEELFEQINQLYENPINLNDTTQLNNIFLLDLLQQKAIKSYILQYGPLYSIEELHMIHGFDSTTINLLRPITTTKIISKKKLCLKNIFNYGHHNLVVGVSQDLEEKRGYQENIYYGNPLRLYYRYYFKYENNIQIMLSGEKDPGETLFGQHQPYGFDFYGYHLMINDIGRIKRAIIGQYYLQFGQGLTLWTGFNPYHSINIHRHSQSIKPAGVFTEYNYLNGIASTISLHKNIDMTLFYSNVNRDAVPSDSCDIWIQNISNSGYHRTSTELNKKKLVNEQLWGGNIQYNNDNFHIGITAQHNNYSKEIHPLQTPYNIHYFKGNNNSNIGLDASYLWKHLLIFGEFSVSKNKGLAGLCGIQIPINSHTKFCGFYRNLSSSYQNMYSNTIVQNSKSTNEKGFYVSLSTILPFSINTYFSVDLFQFPWLKYRVYGPSKGCEYRVQLSKSIIHNLDFGISYQCKEYEQNKKIQNYHNYIITKNYLHRFHSYLKYNINKWSFVSRISNTIHLNNNTTTQYGILISQNIQYQLEKPNLTINARIAYFNSPTYDTRIFCIENSLQYEYNSTTLMNKGLRFYFVIHYNITKKLAVNAKYSISYYFDKENIGSNYNLISSNHQQNIKLQLRWKF